MTGSPRQWTRRALLASVVVVTAALAPAAAASTPLRVMDWNIEGGAPGNATGGPSWAGIERTIRAVRPDIITLQEVHNNSGHSVDGKTGINEWARLLKDLPGYSGHYARADGSGYGGSAGNMILSRYPIEQRVTYRLPNIARCPNTRDHGNDPNDTCPVNRSLGGVEVRVGATDVRVYTTHLTVGLSAAPSALRQAQVGYILGKLPYYLVGTPMLFTGDFNAFPGDVIRPPIAQLDWVDTWTHWNDNVGASAVTHAGGPDARIDYTYATPALDVVRAATVPTPYSDHRAVVTDLSIRSTLPIAVGTVRAGAKARAGWASLDVFSNRSARLRVCDNRPDGWGVRAWAYDGGGRLLMHAADGAFATRCAHPIVPGNAIPGRTVLRVCLYRGSAQKGCRQRTVP